jgi:hypothetical protein
MSRALWWIVRRLAALALRLEGAQPACPDCGGPLEADDYCATCTRDQEAQHQLAAAYDDGARAGYEEGRRDFEVVDW